MAANLYYTHQDIESSGKLLAAAGKAKTKSVFSKVIFRTRVDFQYEVMPTDDCALG